MEQGLLGGGRGPVTDRKCHGILKNSLFGLLKCNTVCGSCTYVHRPLTPVGEVIQSDVHARIRPRNALNEPSDRRFAW